MGIADLTEDGPFRLFRVGAIDPGRPKAALPESAVAERVALSAAFCSAVMSVALDLGMRDRASFWGKASAGSARSFEDGKLRATSVARLR